MMITGIITDLHPGLFRTTIKWQFTFNDN